MAKNYWELREAARRLGYEAVYVTRVDGEELITVAGSDVPVLGDNEARRAMAHKGHRIPPVEAKAMMKVLAETGEGVTVDPSAYGAYLGDEDWGPVERGEVQVVRLALFRDREGTRYADWWALLHHPKRGMFQLRAMAVDYRQSWGRGIEFGGLAPARGR